jgi:hypothetical protein
MCGALRRHFLAGEMEKTTKKSHCQQKYNRSASGP